LADPLVTIEETAEVWTRCTGRGKIRAIGVSNFSVGQMERFRRVAPLHVLQPLTICSNARSKPTCCLLSQNKIATLGYGALCRGLLPDACGRIHFSAATIFAAATRNSFAPVLLNILRPCNDSIGSLSNASASA